MGSDVTISLEHLNKKDQNEHGLSCACVCVLVASQAESLHSSQDGRDFHMLGHMTGEGLRVEGAGLLTYI